MILSSDDLVLAQPPDLRVREAKLAQHFARVLAAVGRRRYHSARRATESDRLAKYAKRAQETAVVYDRELDRWLVIVHSALDDVQRRLVEAKLRRQLWRALRPMPTGTNPPALPPLKH